MNTKPPVLLSYIAGLKAHNVEKIAKARRRSVTKDGKPITGLQVQFIPLDEEIPKGRPEYSLPGGMGILRLDGSYTVFQHRGPVGLKADRYAVTFAPTPELLIDDRKKDNPVPEKYRDAKTTPYRVEVKQDVRNRFDFKLDGE